MKTQLFKSILCCTVWLTVYVTVLCLLTLCWVGAEYTFEGHVHSSDVDGVIACILSYFISRAVWSLGRKMVQK